MTGTALSRGPSECLFALEKTPKKENIRFLWDKCGALWRWMGRELSKHEAILAQVPCRWMTPHPVISAAAAPSAAHFFDQPDMKLIDSWDVSQNWIKPTFWLFLTSNDIRTRWNLSSAKWDVWNNVKRICQKNFGQTPNARVCDAKNQKKEINVIGSVTWHLPTL